MKTYNILGLDDGYRMWIPEIWKGHMENFNGFNEAMNYLRSNFE